jgi:hypothetical protein
VRFLLGSPILHTLEGQLLNAIQAPLLNPASLYVRTLFMLLLQRLKQYYAEQNQRVVILVDMSPGASMMNQNLLLSCDHLVLPSTPDDNSKVSLKLLFNYLHRWRATHTYLPAGHNTKLQLVVLNRYKVVNVAQRTMGNTSQAFFSHVQEMIQTFCQQGANAPFLAGGAPPALLRVQDGMRFSTIASKENASLAEINNATCSEHDTGYDAVKLGSILHEIRDIAEQTFARTIPPVDGDEAAMAE